jgi:hypothetical protein
LNTGQGIAVTKKENGMSQEKEPPKGLVRKEPGTHGGTRILTAPKSQSEKPHHFKDIRVVRYIFPQSWKLFPRLD